MNLAEQIRKSRRALRMTQAQLGAKLRVSQGAISSWENGHDKPSAPLLFLLADITGDQTFVSRENFTDAKPMPPAKPLRPKPTTARAIDVLIQINENLKRIADVLEEVHS